MILEKELFIDTSTFCKKITVYTNPAIPSKAALLYFHGGGLLYGTRADLPSLHLRTFTDSGFVVIAYDYPLAPVSKLDTILTDVADSIWHYIKNPDFYIEKKLPYFLWGRSAGAYLCLLACKNISFSEPPKGILSWYGYGFLCDHWFSEPNTYYCSLPKVSSSCLDAIPEHPVTEGDLNTRYSLYVYARQTGLWKALFYEGREKDFYLKYSLRTYDCFPCPLFCAHSINDTDVPYSEFLELCSKYRAKRFVVSRPLHDFDRDESDSATSQLLDQSVDFLNRCLL